MNQLPNLFVFLSLAVFSLLLLTSFSGDEPEWAAWGLAILGVASAIASAVLIVVIAKSVRDDGIGSTSRKSALNEVCPKCGQVADGQGGEYPCSECGVPTLHDSIAVAAPTCKDVDTSE